MSFFFSPEKLALSFLLKEVNPYPDHKTTEMNLQKNDNGYHVFPPKWRLST